MSYNYYKIQQNGVVSSCNSMNDCRSSVVCPKPRRVGIHNSTDTSRPLRWHLGYQADICDARAGNELMDIILSKGGQSTEKSSMQVPSSPFFSGSPPSRVSNPIIHDARFRAEKHQPPLFSPLPSSPIPTTPSSASSNSSSIRKGGCVRSNFGNYPAVRVEGFDCLDRDRRNCSIPGLA